MSHLGINLEHVVRSSKKPVLVASRVFKPINRLLIAFDGGSSANKAIDHLANSPVFKDIECQLLVVGSESSKGAQQLQQAAAKLRSAGFSVDVNIEQGLPEEVISRHVETDGFDLLVMGGYGHSHIRNFFVGSTTSAMLASCKIPVLLFH
jgi:nucleotide-binding universal stress UspA family protein